ncbi:MAG TPA: LysR family transcriptional regulator [Thermoanaerobaculia bacterium]|nr:LysR family transcriptional regulator [Thermoanaerobaculia bacterium]
MDWLNYNHLHYFWIVAREGSIARATKVLHLTQPTISAQLRQLEDALGEKLLAKEGRGLALTEAGRIAFRYADEIFALGREMRDTLRDRPSGRPLRATIGIADAIPKLVAYRILRPALDAPLQAEIIFREGTSEVLLAALAQHEVDLVLLDAPASRTPLQAHNHFVGASGTTFFGAGALVDARAARFPASLAGAPFLLPAAGTQLRRALERWLEEKDIVVRRAGEFDDLALLTVFGMAGRGIFAAPTAIENEILAGSRLRILGRAPELEQRFYLVSVGRKVRNPAVAAILEKAPGAFSSRARRPAS